MKHGVLNVEGMFPFSKLKKDNRFITILIYDLFALTRNMEEKTGSNLFANLNVETIIFLVWMCYAHASQGVGQFLCFIE